MQYKIPLVLTPQPEGGYTVTSPLLPELVTEGDTAEEAIDNVKDALAAVVEIYEDFGRPLPASSQVLDLSAPLSFETVVNAQ
ncbi:MAG TPA: type II toxin-antitoxin system HicB family antitoxin [Pirellulales bacterium]|jgi:antitoxin HicB